MPDVIHERHYDEPGYNAGWIIAIVVALLVLLAIFFLWRGGYFGQPTQINIQQPPPTQQTPPPAQQQPPAQQPPPQVPAPGGAPSNSTTP